MRRFAFRLARWLGWLLGLGGVALFSAFVWLTATEAGCRWWVGQLDQRLPELSVGKVRGNLWQGLTLEKLHWRSGDGMRIEAQQASLAVGWAPFWQFRFDLDSVALQHARVVLPASSATGTSTPSTVPPGFDLSLPLPISVRALRVDDLQVLRAGSPHPVLSLPRLHARLHAEGRQLRLVLHEARLQLPAGTGQSIGVDARGRVRLGLAEPNRLSASLAVLTRTPQGWLDSHLALSGKLADVAARVGATWTGFDTPQAAISAQGRVRPTGAEISRLEVDGLGGMVCGSGRLDWQQAFTAAFDGQARSLHPEGLLADLGPPLSGQGNVPTRFDWSLKYAGGDQPPRLSWTLSQLSGQLSGVQFDDLHLGGRLQGDRLEARVDQGTLLDGQVAAQLSLGLSGAQPISARLDLKQARLEPLLGLARRLGLSGMADTADKVGGDLSLTARLDGRLGGSDIGQRSLTIALDPLQGQLTLAGRQRPVKAQLQASLQGADQWRVTRGNVQLGSTRLELSGQLAGDSAQLSGRLKAPQLADFPWPLLGLPALGGSVDGRVDLSGALKRPSLKLDLSAAGLRIGTAADATRIGKLHLSASSTPELSRWQQAAVALKLSAAGIDLPGGAPRIDALRVDSDGWLAQQQTHLVMDSGKRKLQLQLDGGWQGAAGWQGWLRRLQLHDPQLGKVALRKPAKLTLGVERQQLGHACLAQGDSHLCLQGTHATTGSRLVLDGDLSLALLHSWLPPDLSLPGRTKLNADLSLNPQGRPGGKLALQLPDNALILRTATGSQRFNYHDLGLKARLAGEQLHLDLTGRVDPDVALSGQGTIGLTGTRPLALTLDLRAADLRPFAPLLAQFTDAVDNPAGAVQARLSLGGTIARPQTEGQITATGLGFDVPASGVAYSDGRIEATIDRKAQLRFKGSLRGDTITEPPDAASADKTAKSDKTDDEKVKHASRHPNRGTSQPVGRLAVTGSADLARLPKWHLDAEVLGNTVPMLALPNLYAWATPDLKIAADQAGARITGSVLLPKVRARVEKLPESAVAPTQDVVIEGQRAEAKPQRYSVRADIRLRLGDAVTLEGMGFSSHLGGGMKLQLQPGSPVAAFGEIDLIDGRYQAYGQDLKIDNGRLIFAGPVGDPGLAVTASRKVGDTEVGLKIGGTLRDPKTDVYSSPSMSQSEALSLLLTGRKLNDSNAADGAMLLAAISGLGISQGENIARDIGQTLGLDEVGVDSGGSGEGLSGARLTLGKRIGDRLFVRYAVGVLGGVGELITRYKINRFLDLQVTAAPDAQGGDLIYRIERGKPKQESSGK